MTTAAPAQAEQDALRYFGAGSGEAWRWREDGDVLAWNADGGTVVFRDELVAILEWLAPSGLPPFPALALLLAACRGRTLTVEEALGPAEILALPDDPQATAQREFRRRCVEVLDRLTKLGRWPRGLLADPRSRALLAEAAFQGSGGSLYTPEQAHGLSAALRAGLNHTALNRSSGQRITYPAALTALLGLLTVTPESLARRLRTGLDEPVLPAPLPPEAFRPPAELARQWLNQLRQRPEHAGLARAARDLLAALSLPRRLPETAEAELGGVADLANRGSLDKLLLSELAHDDLTLAARVALNEALYLRREPPAAPHGVALALLLDSGVRLWGVPRIFAAAAALALGAVDTRRPALYVWRAAGDGVEAVDLLSADGLQIHLGALTTDVHPGAALPAFVEALGASSKNSRRALEPMEAEAIILTHRDALADPTFRRALDAVPRLPGLRLLVGTVDRDGGFELAQYPSPGPVPLCRVAVRLDEIQGSASRAAGSSVAPAPLLDPRLPANLPAILRLPRLPFLLPLCDKVTARHVSPEGRTLAATGQRTLLAWGDPRSGAETLVSGLPPGRVVLLAPEAGTPRFHLLTAHWREGSIPLATYDADTGSLRTLALAVTASPLAARLEAGVILLFYPARVDAFRLSDGEKLSSLAPRFIRWAHGRFYRDGRGWIYAAWDGLAVTMKQVHGDLEQARVIFDRDDRPGPWLLTHSGEVLHLESGGKVFSFRRPLAPADRIDISRDGHHVRVHCKEAGTVEQVHLKQSHPVGDWSLLTGPIKPLEDTLSSKPPQYPLMNRFSHVCVLPEGGLALRSARGQLLAWTRCATGEVLLHPIKLAALDNRRERPFAPMVLPDGCLYRLREAVWPNGSRALLDSRGLLHLVGADPSLPEISLVLANATVAVCPATGEWPGHHFFSVPTVRPRVWATSCDCCNVFATPCDEPRSPTSPNAPFGSLVSVGGRKPSGRNFSVRRQPGRVAGRNLCLELGSRPDGTATLRAAARRRRPCPRRSAGRAAGGLPGARGKSGTTLPGAGGLPVSTGGGPAGTARQRRGINTSLPWGRYRGLSSRGGTVRLPRGGCAVLAPRC